MRAFPSNLPTMELSPQWSSNWCVAWWSTSRLPVIGWFFAFSCSKIETFLCCLLVSWPVILVCGQMCGKLTKSCTFSPWVNSRWTALVEVHVNKEMYSLSWLCLPCSALDRFPLTYSGPAKSRPVCENGGSSETRWFDKSANCGGLHVAISYLQQTMQCCKIFTVSRPRKNQNCSLKVVSVALMPECFTRSCVCLTRRLTKVCLAGRRIRDFVDGSNEAWLIRRLHLIVWSSLRNSPNCVTRIGGVAFQSFRFRKDSSSINADACTDLIPNVSAFFNLSALNSFKFCWLRWLVLRLTYAVTRNKLVMLL